MRTHVVALSQEDGPCGGRAHHNKSGWQSSVGSYFDVGSASEVALEPRDADEKICFMGAPNVREGEPLTSRSIQVLK